MRRNTFGFAAGLAAVLISGSAMAQSIVGPTIPPIGGDRAIFTVMTPSAETKNRLIVDVNTRPLDINLFASTTRVASKQTITYPAGSYHSFKEAVDLPGLPGSDQ